MTFSFFSVFVVVVVVMCVRVYVRVWILVVCSFIDVVLESIVVVGCVGSWLLVL